MKLYIYKFLYKIFILYNIYNNYIINNIIWAPGTLFKTVQTFECLPRCLFVRVTGSIIKLNK